MLKYKLTISFLLVSVLLLGQNDKKSDKLKDVFEDNSTHIQDYKGFELGFNITNVLSRFVGNTPGTDVFDFPILMRYHLEKSAFRLGVGATFSRSNFFDATTATFRETEERSGTLSVGLERYVSLKKRLTFYYGIDVFAATEFESVATSNFSNSIISKDIIRFGGGPFVGLSYSINYRVRLHTEMNIAGFYEQTKTTEIISGNDIPIADTDRYGGQISPPIALYINLKF